MTLEIKVHPHAAIMEMLAEGLVDLALTTHQPPGFTSFTLRTSPTLWYCAAEYVLAKGNLSPDPARRAKSIPPILSPRWKLLASVGIWPTELPRYRA